VKLLREPEAAAFAYTRPNRNQYVLHPSHDSDDNEQLILVFDLGGGTYDVSMISMNHDVTEIISTSGNPQLGGSVFDYRIGTYFYQMIINHHPHVKNHTTSRISANTMIVKKKQLFIQCAEYVRIYLSHHNIVNIALPLTNDGFLHLMDHPKSLILSRDYFTMKNNHSHYNHGIDHGILENQQQISQPPRQWSKQQQQQQINVHNNGTHVLFSWKRRDMESILSHELYELIRPIREVAIMSGALLPGDTSPALVDSIMSSMDENDDDDDQQQQLFMKQMTNENDGSSSSRRHDMEDENDISVLQSIKKSQQGGRKRARITAKEERKYRAEKKKMEESSSFKKSQQQQQSTTNNNNGRNTLIRDGITGIPISQIVLVGGVTRMPVIHRLLHALTGIQPQTTVHPDEAVALGCAIQINQLDGNNKQGNVVLNPMQAAIVRALAQQNLQRQRQPIQERVKRQIMSNPVPEDDFDDDFDNDNFDDDDFDDDDNILKHD
jgi:Hsp70 protein